MQNEEEQQRRLEAYALSLQQQLNMARELLRNYYGLTHVTHVEDWQVRMEYLHSQTRAFLGLEERNSK